MRTRTRAAVLANAPAIVGFEPKWLDLLGREPSATAVSASAAPMPTPTSNGFVGKAPELDETPLAEVASEPLEPAFRTCGLRLRLGRAIAESGRGSIVALFDMAWSEQLPFHCTRRAKQKRGKRPLHIARAWRGCRREPCAEAYRLARVTNRG